MPNLRDHTKQALAATEPTDREARDDLQAVLRRARPKRAARAWALAPAFAVAAIVAALIATRHSESPTAIHSPPAPSAPPSTPSQGGLHLYLRTADEPAALALALDLDTKESP